MIETRNAVLERTLDNGLTVLLQESHDAPVASFWIFYRVGSRNELPGQTGISHWVEHMQFKGTPNLAKGAVFGEVSRNGGTLNAFTSYDWTTYFETLPADRLDLSIKIESDRMVNSLFDPEETESERTVILSERQGSENRPGYFLHEEMMGTAFHHHPYGHSIIGLESDLRRITRDELYGHYKHYYTPNNAVVVLSGRVTMAEAKPLAERTYGRVAARRLRERGVVVRELDATDCPPSIGRVDRTRPRDQKRYWAMSSRRRECSSAWLVTSSRAFRRSSV